MNQDEFEQFSLVVLRVLLKKYGDMDNLVKMTTSYEMIEGDMEGKEFTVVKLLGLLGSISARVEEVDKGFYLENNELLLKMDDFIISLWCERYDRNSGLGENLNNFLKNLQS